MDLVLKGLTDKPKMESHESFQGHPLGQIVGSAWLEGTLKAWLCGLSFWWCL